MRPSVSEHDGAMPEVVVPLDGTPRSESVLPHALAFARGGPVTLVSTRRDDDVQRRQAYLDEHVTNLGLTGAETVVVLDRGPADSILVTAHRHPGSVICMATHARGGLGEEFLGSVAEEVVRDAEPPVLLVGPEAAATPGTGTTMLIAVDTPESARSVVLPSVAIASSLGLDVKAVHVIAPPPIPLAPDADVPPRSGEQDAIEAAAAEFAECGIAGTTEVVRGPEPAHTIVDLANSLPAALVVVGTHARRGFARLALGSVAMRVVRHARCPVLVVRA
jgi:nucleotide-binding universal stress UspA family protein